MSDFAKEIASSGTFSVIERSNSVITNWMKALLIFSVIEPVDYVAGVFPLIYISFL